MANHKKGSSVKFSGTTPGALRQRIHLQQFISKLFGSEHKKMYSLNYVFCSDDYLLEINKQFLNHDDLTDIITFDLSENPAAITGEIYISIERVRENAIIYKTPFSEELKRVMFHGALHLCGYKDKLAADKARMRAKEDHYLKKYAIAVKGL